MSEQGTSPRKSNRNEYDDEGGSSRQLIIPIKKSFKDHLLENKEIPKKRKTLKGDEATPAKRISKYSKNKTSKSKNRNESP